MFYSKHIEKRGSIYTIYSQKDFPIDFVQDKISRSYRGVIRGFHGDNKTWKLITCLYGKVKLITYDIEKLEKKEYILNGEAKEQQLILVPPKILNAHQCLTEECIFHYKWSHYYTSPHDQWSVHFEDPIINALWDKNIPLIISKRDSESGTLLDLKKQLGTTQ